jgi:hypothetical protein
MAGKMKAEIRFGAAKSARGATHFRNVIDVQPEVWHNMAFRRLEAVRSLTPKLMPYNVCSHPPETGMLRRAYVSTGGSYVYSAEAVTTSNATKAESGMGLPCLAGSSAQFIEVYDVHEDVAQRTPIIHADGV